MESRPEQYIPRYFSLLDSKLYQELDARSYKLYDKMRRHICRSSSHRLAGYYQNGLLAVEGYMESWAKWLGVSRSTISRLLNEMESKNIIFCHKKSSTIGDPNIYILGRVLFIDGSTKTIEIFYFDYLADSEIISKIHFESDTSHLSTILTSDIDALVNEQLKIKARLGYAIANGGRAGVNGGRAGVNGGRAGVNTFNIESNIEESNIINTSSPKSQEPERKDLFPFPISENDSEEGTENESNYSDLFDAFLNASKLPLAGGNLKPRDNEALTRMVAAGILPDDIKNAIIYCTQENLMIVGPASIERGAIIEKAKRERLKENGGSNKKSSDPVQPKITEIHDGTQKYRKKLSYQMTDDELKEEDKKTQKIFNDFYGSQDD